MNEKFDLSKLSPAEQQEIARLIAENERLDAENLKFQNDLLTKDEEIVKLETETLAKEETIALLKNQVDELMKVLIKDKHLLRKYNVERYETKADSPSRVKEAKGKRANGLPNVL